MVPNPTARTKAPLALLLLIVAPACSEIVNPFRDDLPASSAVTTPSADRVRDADMPPDVRQRDWDRTLTATQDQGVSHWPLWFEDSLEDSGSEDGQFAWSWLDYGAVAYGPARQFLNLVAVPVSAIVDPPWALKCSDGVISPQTFGFRNHDAVACSGAAMLPDLIMEPQASHAGNPTMAPASAAQP